MKLAQLDIKHDDYDADECLDLWAIYKGGKEFRARIKRFLDQNPLETADAYTRRLKRARYKSYVGAIIDFVAGAVFEDGVTPKPCAEGGQPGGDVPEWYAEFKESCDGKGTDLVDFAKARLVESLAIGRSLWRIELPRMGDVPAASKEDYEKEGRGDAELHEIPATELYDWEHDDDGRLIFAVVHSCSRKRRSLVESRDMVVERWDVYGPDTVDVYEVAYEKDKRPLGDADVPQGSSRPHGFDGVPIIVLTPPIGLFLGDRLRDPQLGCFEADVAYTHSLRQSAYAMPYIASNEELRPNTAFGAGHYLQLAENTKVGFLEPSGGAAASLKTAVDDARQEIYRVAHQMAQGVDNNNTAIGRSGESKKADQSSSETMLTSYGASVREALKRTYDLVSAARGDDTEWDIAGMSDYGELNITAVLEDTATAQGLSIPSKTFRTEIQKRAARALLPDIDDATRALIDKEITEGTSDESMMPPVVRPGAPALIPPKPMAAQEDEEDEDEPPSEPTPKPKAKA